MADLLPCPFCGGDARTLQVGDDSFAARCLSVECAAAGLWCLTPEGAIAAWNRRAATWDDLMALLDQHWPADVFPAGDDPKRDAGARIVGLLRWVDQLKREANRCT